MTQNFMFRQPTHRPALYYASIGAIILEYAAAIFFMMSLAQRPVTMAICLLIALCVSTYTITMWGTVGDLVKKGKYLLVLLIVVVLNSPAFVYDVHGFLGVMSEVQAEFEKSTDLAKTEKDFLTAQIENSRAMSKMTVDPASISSETNKLTAENNKLIQSKKHCKTRWGSCIKDIDAQIESNNREIETLSNSLTLAANSLSATNATKTAVQETLNGSNDNKKTHGAFQTLSWWFYKDVTHAKELQGNILGYSAVFFAFLVMLIPFLAQLLCFDAVSEFETARASSPALQPGSDESRLWTNKEPKIKAEEQPEQPEPKSWSDRYKAGEVSAWSGLFNRNQPNAAGTTAYSVNAPTMYARPAVSPVERPNADAPLNYGVSELSEYSDADAVNTDAVNTHSPTILDGIGFAAPVIPNPNYQPPIIHWPIQNSAGVEISGIAEPDADEITPPAASECVQIDADVRVQTDADAPSADADAPSADADSVKPDARSVVSLAKTANIANSVGRGVDSLMEYSDLENAVIRSNFLLKEDGAVGQNLVEKFMGVGRPKAKRFIALLIENGVINAELKPIIMAKGE